MKKNGSVQPQVLRSGPSPGGGFDFTAMGYSGQVLQSIVHRGSQGSRHHRQVTRLVQKIPRPAQSLPVNAQPAALDAHAR